MFLGGKLHLLQPAHGYRGGVDPVVLAASCTVQPGQSVLDIGCGVGTVGLCIAARVPGVHVTGLELLPDYAAMARQNANDNGIEMTVYDGDVADAPAELRQLQFDHVVTNPPFFKHSTLSKDDGKHTGRAGQTPLASWLDFAVRRVAPKGHLTLIQAMPRLDEVLATLHGRLGSFIVQPLASRAGRDPKLFILQAKKSGRADFQLKTPIAVHAGDQHVDGGNDYDPAIANVLRNGAAFSIFD